MHPSPALPIAALPDDVGVLQELVRGLLASHQAERQRNTELQERIDQLIRRLYGVKSDKLGQNQPGLFDGLEEGQPPEADQPPPPPPEPEPVPNQRRRSAHGRRKIPDDLARVTRTVDFTPTELSALGGEWKRIGEEVSEKLDYKTKFDSMT